MGISSPVFISSVVLMHGLVSASVRCETDNFISVHQLLVLEWLLDAPSFGRTASCSLFSSISYHCCVMVGFLLEHSPSIHKASKSYNIILICRKKFHFANKKSPVPGKKFPDSQKPNPDAEDAYSDYVSVVNHK